MNFNKYQTPVTIEELDTLPLEIKEQFLDIINNIPFVKSMIAENRPYAKDLPRDNDGKIIIDITQPHIIEDADYFRPTALHYKKYGCFTKLRPNANPNSEYGKWLREEVRRCWEGYIRPEDGEWITGDMYFFLNYCPIQLIKKSAKGETIRTIDFPSFFDGNYYRFHYLNQCRTEGHHAMELAKRGAGKAHPYDEYVWTPNGIKLWKDVHVGDLLFGDDGNVTKVVDIPFDDVAPIYMLELANGFTVQCSEGHLWKVNSHTRGEIIVSTKELLSMYKKPRKISSHNPAGYELDCSIPMSKGVDFPYQETKVDPYTFGLLLGDGCFRVKKCDTKTYFTSSDEDFEVYKNYIPYNWIKYNNTKFGYNLNIPNFGNILSSYGLYFTKSEDKFIPKEYMYNSREVRINILKGILDSDGTVDKGRIELCVTSKQLVKDVKFLCASLGINCTKERIKHTWYKNSEGKKIKCLDAYRLSIFSEIPLFNLPRKLELWNNRPQTNYAKSKYKGTKIVDIKYIGNKRAKCVTVDNDSHCYLINNFIVTHNSYSAAALLAKRFILGESNEVKKKVQCVATASERKYIQGANQLLDMFQYYIDFCANNTEFPSQRLTSSLQNMQWTMGYIDVDSGTRQGTQNSVIGITSKDDESKLRGSRGVLYLLEEAGSFPRLLNLYQVLRPSVEDGNRVFGLIYGYGTSGDSDSDFSSMQELMYNPDGYNIKGVPNVYDKEGQGRKKFTYFYPGYLNRADCYDKDGNSDVTKAILEILKDRYKVKYNSTDINAITKRIAEIPITPQEAIQRSRGNIFPITELTNRLNEIDNNPNFYDDVYTGTLLMNSNGKVEFSIKTEDKPIRDFPTKDNKVTGALEIYEMPQEIQGKVPSERYIASLDNYENDESNTMSLGSLFVLDLWTDRIVAEYTGRPMFVDDLNELARKVCLFYNAKLLYEAHPYSQIVKTPYGSKLWGDVSIGDTLFSPNGETVKVVDIPVDTEMPIYKITLEDGREVMAGDNHIWSVYKLNNTKEPILITTKEMLELGVKNKHNQHNFFIPNGGIVNYEKQEVPIDPYTLGLLIAEGCFVPQHCHNTVTQLSSNEDDINFYKTIVPYKITRKDKGYNWNIHIENGRNLLDSIGLYGHKSYTKHIPALYLFNSVDTRMELLKGLMDGDGCANSKGAKIFITTSKYLADDIMSLCRSLGINSRVRYNEIKRGDKIYKHYRVTIYTEEIIFKLPRKVQNCHKYQLDSKGSKAKAYIYKTAIKSIEYSHREKGKCVTVDSEDGLYMIGDYIVTHNCNKKNTFSYFSRMNSLHLLADTPEYLRNKQLIKFSGYGNTSKGVNASLPIKNFGFTLIRDWLLKPVTIIKEEDGNPIEYTVPNLHFIKNRALIKELMLYNPDINVDRIMSLVQLMLFREEKMIMYQGDPAKNSKKEDKDYLGNDPFFTKNFRPGKKQ